ncbi:MULTISPECIES: DUF2167 domain-containing protein [Burkholderia]|uniref:DUF2167 domain-containing protein n=1 Tax=Burkholderia TaxID=32008 RepID=UPI0005AD1DB1|nr:MULTISPECIES: DUF2167 domain-containing protein [Burkholderia]KIP17618.1 hypothetical protein KY49_6648 [Burkholderia sp. MSHR3999]KVD49583.1 hypothetical protein WI86_16915 [Burkholderia ubonensis]KVD49653.1 hypothetical protein WI85_14475 [Burkholderia ubonensis]KVD68679.1 hypothetical protein WI88_32485 [Burkholderia ubonensis]KVP68151.1 hypothetical protein WJ90_17000 [Burkholderia ubonensis]
MKKTVALIACTAFLALAATTGRAQTESAQAEMKAASAALNKAVVKGPADIDLKHQAVLKLTQGEAFVPAAEAGRYLRAMGNTVDESKLVGMVLPADPDADWISVVSFEPSGYIRDDDAKDWKPDELLASLKEGTEEGNASRKERGLPEFEVVGWAQPPAYDANKHRLVWSSIMRDKGALPNPVTDGANYRTLALGRDGYLSLTLVSSLDDLPKYKPSADDLLAHIDFKDGKRYADFNKSTDHVAEYGLAALIVGVGAKKLGLLAVIGAFVAKFFKVGLVALLGGGAALKRFFGRKPKAAAAPAIADAADTERKE